MSLLKTGKRSNTGPLSVRVPDTSTNVVALIKRVLAPPLGSNRYPSLSVVFLSKCTIPYIYKKGSDGNLVTEKDEYEPLEIEGGGETTFVSIYSVPAGVGPGDLVFIEGLFYTAWRKADSSGKSFTCVKISKYEIPFVPTEILKIPRANRLPDVNRDVLCAGRSFDVAAAPYMFFAVQVTKNPVVEADGEAYGEFQIPEVGDPNGYSFVPFTEKGQQPKGRIDSLTGGTDADNKVTDNQFAVCINAYESDIDSTGAVLLTVRCRLYSDSIQRFMIGGLWSKLGPVMAPHLHGVALCMSDPSKTANQIYDPSSGYNGAMFCSVSFFPDLAVIARSCGVQCTWDEAVAISGNVLKNPSDVKCSTYSNARVSQSTAINLMEYAGDATRLKQGADDGEIHFYVVANFTDGVRHALGEKELVLTQVFTKKFHEGNFVNSQVALAIYAVLSDKKSQYRIHDYLRVHADLPAPIDTLRKLDARRMLAAGEDERPKKAVEERPKKVAEERPKKVVEERRKKARVSEDEEEEESE